MPLKKNTALINQEADTFGALFDGGTLEIYTGSQPSDQNGAPSGSLLATVNIPSPAFGAAVAGVITNNAGWADAATATGTAGWARMISADTLKTFDATVTDVPGGNNLLISTVDIVISNVVGVNSLTITIPAS